MIEVDEQIAKPLNLANSAVLRAVEEEEQQQVKCGYKRVAWPPASEERIVREFTPQPTSQTPTGQNFSQPAQQHQQQPLYHQQQQQPPSSAVPSQPQQQQQQQHQMPYYQQPEQQNYVQEPSGPAAQGWRPIRPPTAKQYSEYNGHSVATAQSNSAYAPFSSESQPQYQQQSYNNYPPQQQQQYQPPQQQYQPPQYNQQAPPQAQYQAPNQYQQSQQQVPPYQQQQPHWAHHQQPQQQQQYQPQYQQQPNYQSQSQSNYQSQPPQQQPQYQQSETQSNQYNSYSQPQQQQISQDQPDYRGSSPGIITLRKEAPVTQKPSPVFTSQPAAVSFQGGSNMRGDLKWPPPEYKEAAALENEERRKLALGPVCRPRKVHRDYTPFFAKNALNSTYPSYKVPPGTQHMLS